MGQQYLLTDFLAGEIADTLEARVDLSARKRGCKTLENAFVLPRGGVQKRPGSYRVGTSKTAGKRVRLIPYLLSQTEGIVCEFGDSYIRFFRDTGPLGAPYEKTTTYTEAELRKLRHAQVGDVLRIVHQEHKSAKLARVADDNWTLADITFTAGAGEEDFNAANHYPGCIEVYEDRLILAATETNPDTFWGSNVSLYDKFMQRRSAVVTITIATPGVVSWTAHGLTESQPVVFSTTGALPTGLTPGVVYYVVGASIAADTFQVSATPGGAAINTSGTQSGVHTCYCNLPLPSDAWQKTPHAKKHNQILWLLAENTLLFGTSTGLWRVGGPETALVPNTAWWPKQQADVGCADVEALLVDDLIVFVEKGGERVRMATYAQDVDKYQTTDLTAMAEHIGEGGIVELAYQRSPSPMLWAVRSDGVLLSMGLSKEEQVVGWSRHDLSGEVESVCVIPTATEDQVWVSVKRTVSGSVVRHIEYFKPRKWAALTDYFYVDAGKSWNGGTPETITAITKAATAQITLAGTTAFVNDDHIRIAGCDMTEVNGQVYMLKNKAGQTFNLYLLDGVTPLNSSGFGQAGTTGSAEKVFKTLTGLGYLEGKTVVGIGDGATVQGGVVTAGAVTMGAWARVMHVGLPYYPGLEPRDLALALGKYKRITELFIFFYKTVGALAGPTAASVKPVIFRRAGFVMGVPIQPYTGGYAVQFQGPWQRQTGMYITQEDPLPWTVLGLVADVEVA